MDCLILRFDAPLMSFGSVVVDQINPIWSFPAKSMLVGLLANSLGWDHRDASKCQSLQNRLRFAARWDAEPELLTEYQTVDLGQDLMVDTGWTTRGRREDRGKGAATTGTHIRYRDHWANGVATVALALDDDGDPTIDLLEKVLRTPIRPLFIGRKPCLPATQILVGRRKASGVRSCLAREPLADIGPRKRPRHIMAMWPMNEGEGSGTEERYDLRSWANNVHSGSERYAVGIMEVVT